MTTTDVGTSASTAASAMDQVFPVRNPYSGGVAFNVRPGGPARLASSVRVAKTAFRTYLRTPAHQRAAWLSGAAAAMESVAVDLVEMTIAHIGKPRKAAEMEVKRSVAFVRACATHLHSLKGELVPVDMVPNGAALFGFTRRVPYGVVAAVTPFNAPSNLLVQKLAPALITGNAVIIKPCLEGTEIAGAIAKAFIAGGVPEGLVQVLPGDREEALGLAAHSDVDVVTLTGGTAAGDALARAAGAKRFIGELGGNSPNIVLADADLEDAVKRIVPSSFEASGQQCISTQRIIVEASVFDAFLRRFIDAAKRLKVGDPTLPDTDLGPVVSSRAAARITAMIDDARGRGCRVETCGEVVDCIIPPTIVVDPPVGTRLIREEVFGPVVVVMRASDIDDAIRIANDCEFGLQGSCFTSSLANALRMSEEVHVGSLWINEASRFRLDNYPFGGVGRSGVGREGLPYAFEEYTQPKFTGIRLP
ncbi:MULTISPECIES: aldehyde dehydrogenase family protein [Bradyrhizobium]|jgi:acyl-CoA reductase-like NAD-dependent aldehyde dehydrogenase|uniref:Acyl-CoA reductase-like NAD-dependent aldehyde dehydrogenase n=1 Tax=Bradyrhizobium elkanii TaxID=29448 RepID=A0ABV4F7M1_BRAEL|nr:MULTISPECIES: aldehyde dehydrogenase family protein [Bradyrhizobium]MCA1396236.1 aldehyde dehydrogenase [Bradyrhizobium sp. BRP56]MCP1751050.1 acyl-CoA reductase-like NAD-dependent aldehyde dehydrogenase [Bradyrhizobium elkanii]MCP1976822.1 acyl-CoA reductase-like NAD-dependent aldehyde dehydrogenase [Bradyrhizobium elkanii]MCS3447207.1 acyl-CoA reductase-like NAD-dependent aldehyde dehydrogenase [Bradyrhizobium elkanii]MCS3561657.1 acyl-CoA reductase-like NAD-dependent aldehyde dehydrogena